MSEGEVRFAVYGDVDLNIIDGSAVWLQSTVSVLARQPRLHTTVVLKARQKRDLLTGPLGALESVTIINPIEEGRFAAERLSRAQALTTLSELDDSARFDAVLLRGFGLCYEAATQWRRRFGGRLWCYLTDIPQHRSQLTTEALEKLEAIAAASRFLLCQTEELRCHLEAFVSGVAGKALIFPPMIPDGAPSREARAETGPLQLVYVGKYAPHWNTYEMTQVVAALRARDVSVELHLVGDKIHRDPSDQGYHERMSRALSQTDGVHWHGARSRAETQELMTHFDVALGWRDPEMDDSLELSTKLLEYGAAGLPVIFNRTPMHERLFGGDYPLFANDQPSFERAVLAARDPDVRRQAASKCADVARGFTFASVGQQLTSYIDRAVSRRKPGQGPESGLRVLVASHDLKFFQRIREHLESIQTVQLRLDEWQSIDRHSEARSQVLLEWADVIICEWCGENAVWYSKHKRPGQRLIVRLHRAELYSPLIQNVQFDRIDTVVFVGEFYRQEAEARLRLDPDRLMVIPNCVDTGDLARQKLFGAPFNLGMLGIAPKRKRPDRALTLLERLRAVDDRFQLFLKTKMPWEYSWVWRELDEQAYFRDLFQRINSSPLLRGAVHFEPFGRDVAAWLRKIGFVLSTSDDESFHLAPAEGMASGSLPLLLDWNGADAIYPADWVHTDESAMVDTILDVLAQGSWPRHSAQAQRYVEEHYAAERVCAAWEDLVVS